MTRRVIAAAALSAFVLGLGAQAASAAPDGQVCVGGESQRKPGTYQGICVGGDAVSIDLPPY